MNIKDVAKVLTGKTLDRYNRGIGLAPLSIINNDQSRILQGIYSQVDNSYLSKTEQSSVLHLDGSGDGVVELVGIEGSSLVNLAKNNIVKKELTYKFQLINDSSMCVSSGKVYTILTEYNIPFDLKYRESNTTIKTFATDIQTNIFKFNAIKDEYLTFIGLAIGQFEGKFLLLEGDYTNKPIPSEYFKGLQSSFEDKLVTQEQVDSGLDVQENVGKYKCDVELVGKNLLPPLRDWKIDSNHRIVDNYKLISNPNNAWGKTYVTLKLKKGETYTIASQHSDINKPLRLYIRNDSFNSPVIASTGFTVNDAIFVAGSDTIICSIENINTVQNSWVEDFILVKGKVLNPIFEEQVTSKQTLYLNSPLLKGDRLECRKDGVYHVHNSSRIVLDGSENFVLQDTQKTNTISFQLAKNDVKAGNIIPICDKFPSLGLTSMVNNDIENICTHNSSSLLRIRISRSKLATQDVAGFKAWLKTNPTTIVYELAEPWEEKILNPYGNPLLMPCYEKGTLYINSVIVPTTTVRYTPKMESFKASAQLQVNNETTTNSISKDVVPKMMDLDFEILLKEMHHPNPYTMRAAADVAIMQERTYEMLAKLIEGKSLMEQEVKERIAVYLEAKRITNEQATNLQLLIEGKYK